MSEILPQKPEQSEEIDLGQLFKQIGAAFDRLFNFIVNIFIGIYKLIIMFLMHFYKRKYWYIGVVVLGFIIGFIADKSSNKLYGANIFIETNFNSARQVYENIKQFHELAHVDKDTLTLANRLNISKKEASKLKGFYIEPDLDENDIVQMYSDFYLRLDSLSRLDVSYEDYKKSLTPYNFRIHKIGVESTDKMLYKKIETALVNDISENEYLNKLLDVNRANLEKKDKVLLIQVKKTDSLVNEYLKIRKNESTKVLVPGSGTNLYMGDAESSNLIVDESKIIDKRLEFESQRREISTQLVEEQSVVNVLAGFPKSGYNISNWYDNMMFLFPIILFTLTLCLFSIIGLGDFLEKQSN